MKHLMAIVAVGVLLVAAGAQAYDTELARKADAFFGRLDRQTLTTGPCKVSPEGALKWIKDGEKVTFVDIRTPEETSILGMNYKNTLQIPLNVLFADESLKKLPQDGKVIVVCHSGFRAAAASAMLKMIGFNNVVALNGGIMDFARILTPFTAP